MKTLEQLQLQAEQIQENVLPNSNTADLVGDTLKGIVEQLQKRRDAPVGGFVFCDDIDDLPTVGITTAQTKQAYIVGGNVFIYVGEGGDTLGGLYQDCGPLRGEKGDKGEKGDRGDDGIILDPSATPVKTSLADISAMSAADRPSAIAAASVASELQAAVEASEQAAMADAFAVDGVVARSNTRQNLGYGSTGARLQNGTLEAVGTNPANRWWQAVAIADKGLAPGGVLCVTGSVAGSLTSNILFGVAFFAKDEGESVAVGDAYMDGSWFQLSVYADQPVTRYVRIPEGATHIAWSHYSPGASGVYVCAIEIRSTRPATEHPLASDGYTANARQTGVVEAKEITGGMIASASHWLSAGYGHTQKMRIDGETHVSIDCTANEYARIGVAVYSSGAALSTQGQTVPADYLPDESLTQPMGRVRLIIHATPENPRWLSFWHANSNHGSISTALMRQYVAVTEYLPARAATAALSGLADLEVSDASGRDIIRIADGHILTAAFDSRAIPHYKAWQHETLYTYAVSGDRPEDDYAAGRDSYSVVTDYASVRKPKTYTDRAALYLPESYTPTGTPTPVVFFGRQGGGTFTATDNFLAQDIKGSGNYLSVVPLLLSLGYACLAVDGAPDAWAAEMLDGASYTGDNHAFDGYVGGNYIAPRSARRAWELATADYNLDRTGALGFGYSQGGWMIWNIAELSGIPFRGLALKSPVVWLGNYWQDSVTPDGMGENVVTLGGVSYPRWRYFMVRQYYGLSIRTGGADGGPMALDEFLAIPRQPWRWAGYDPFLRHAADPTDTDTIASFTADTLSADMEGVTMRRHCLFPVKVWMAKDDGQVGFRRQATLVKAIRNAGCRASMKLYGKGGHNMAASNWQAAGSFTYRGRTYALYPPAVEWAEFYASCTGRPLTLDIED